MTVGLSSSTGGALGPAAVVEGLLMLLVWDIDRDIAGEAAHM